MTEFHLQIVTPDGLLYNGKAEKIIVRTESGDVGILAKHIDFVTPLGIGVAKVTANGKELKAACAGGILSVTKDVTRIVANTFEWSENIDLERAKRAKERAEAKINQKKSGREIELAKLKLKKALSRIDAAK